METAASISFSTSKTWTMIPYRARGGKVREKWSGNFYIASSEILISSHPIQGLRTWKEKQAIGGPARKKAWPGLIRKAESSSPTQCPEAHTSRHGTCGFLLSGCLCTACYAALNNNSYIVKSYRPEGGRLRQIDPIIGDEVNQEDHDLARTGLQFYFP